MQPHSIDIRRPVINDVAPLQLLPARGKTEQELLSHIQSLTQQLSDYKDYSERLSKELRYIQGKASQSALPPAHPPNSSQNTPDLALPTAVDTNRGYTRSITHNVFSESSPEDIHDIKRNAADIQTVWPSNIHIICPLLTAYDHRQKELESNLKSKEEQLAEISKHLKSTLEDNQSLLQKLDSKLFFLDQNLEKSKEALQPSSEELIKERQDILELYEVAEQQNAAYIDQDRLLREYIKSCEEGAQDLDMQHAQLRAQYQLLHTDYTGSIQEAESNKKALKSSHEEAETLKKDKLNLQSDNEDLKAQYVGLKEENKIFSQKLLNVKQNLDKQIEEWKIKYELKNQELQTSQVQNTAASHKLNDISKQRDDMKSGLEKINDTNKLLQTQMTAQRLEIQNLAEDLRARSHTCNMLQVENEKLIEAEAKAINLAAQQRAHLESKYQQIITEQGERMAQLINDKTSQVGNLQKRINQAETGNIQLKSELVQAKSRITNLEQELSYIQKMQACKRTTTTPKTEVGIQTALPAEDPDSQTGPTVHMRQHQSCCDQHDNPNKNCSSTGNLNAHPQENRSRNRNCIHNNPCSSRYENEYIPNLTPNQLLNQIRRLCENDEMSSQCSDNIFYNNHPSSNHQAPVRGDKSQLRGINDTGVRLLAIPYNGAATSLAATLSSSLAPSSSSAKAPTRNTEEDSIFGSAAPLNPAPNDRKLCHNNDDQTVARLCNANKSLKHKILTLVKNLQQPPIPLGYLDNSYSPFDEILN